MKNKLAILMAAIIVLALLLPISSVFGETGSLELETDPRGNNLKSAPSVEEINYQIHAGKYEIVRDKQGFHRINMFTLGYGIIESPGDPALPEKILEFRVPQDIVWSSVKLTVEIQESEKLPGSYNIPPHPPFKPVVATIDLEYDPEYEDWGVEKSILNGKNMYVYGRDANFPEYCVELLSYTERKEPIEVYLSTAENERFPASEFIEVKYLTLAYRPFLYNPVTQELTLIKKANVRITYDRYPEIESEQVGSSGDTYDYVIITTNDIVSNSAKLADFIHLKELYGHNVKVVTETDFGGLTGQAPNGRAEKIRQWLINNYAALGIDYVLLIGDPDPDDPTDPGDTVGDIPMKMCWPNYFYWGNRDSPTDYFYADLSGNWDLDNDQYFGEHLKVDHKKSPDPSIGEDYFSARWTGKVMCDFNGTYIFYTFSDDGVRLYIDGSLVIDNWAEHLPTLDYWSHYMTAGKHDIMLEFRENTGDGIIRLFWRTPHYERIIARDHLYDASDNVGGLSGTYYDNADFTGHSITSKDNFNFIWGTGDRGIGGPDFGAEVFVGRIPVYDNDYAQLDDILQKIIEYETAGDISWRKTILLPMRPLWASTLAYHLGEAIRNDFALAAGFTCYRIYEENYNPPTPELWPCNKTNVINEWRKGYGMVTWVGHGGATATHFINSTLTHELDDTKPSFTFQLSCFNGCPEHHNNLGYALLKHGAIATVSASRVCNDISGAWTFDPHSGLSHNLAYYYTKKVIDDCVPKSAGVALYLTKGDVDRIYSLATWINLMDYNLYGDPETSLVPPPVRPESCEHIFQYHDGNVESGYYDISPDGRTVINAYCYMTDEQGWTIIDPNHDPNWKNFFKEWVLYSGSHGEAVYGPGCAQKPSPSHWKWREWFSLADNSTSFATSPNCRCIDKEGKVYRMTGNYYGCKWYNRNCDFDGACYKCYDNYNPYKTHGTCPWLIYGPDDDYDYVCSFDWWNNAPSLGAKGDHCVAYSKPITGKEYFIKLSSDQQTLYLQDTYTDPGPDDLNVVLINTSQLNGHATSKLDDATILYDVENSVYKMWMLASTGPNGYWSMYYAESGDLTNWSIQEIFYGTSNKYDANRPNSVSVLKESDTNYKMWYSIYWATHPETHQWSNFIHYRNSSDGINWGPEQLTHNPGNYSDDEHPVALHLQGELDLLYYSYLEGDLPGNWYYPRRMDVAPDGVRESNITQLSATPGYHHYVEGATIIGKQSGDNHHRVWVASRGNLLRYDSFDEGQTWTITNVGTYSTINYNIVETFYDIFTMIDIIPPTIVSVTLDAYTTIPDATIHVTVEATDNVAVTSVTADSVALVEAGSIWEGDITALSTTGDYTITIRAEDAARNFDEATVDYSVVTPQGGFGVAVLPLFSFVNAGDTVDITVKIISTENFDDKLHVYLSTEGLDNPVDLSWFNWTEKNVMIPEGGNITIPLRAEIPTGVSGIKMFRVIAESTIWRTEGFGTGIFGIT